MTARLDPRMEIRAHEDFYMGLRRRVRLWAGREGKDHPLLRWILLAPDFAHLLGRLLLDPRVPGLEKARFGLVMAYFVSPFDLLPEGLLGPAGLADDVVLVAYALDRFVNRHGAHLLREHWSGDEEILDVLSRVIASADRIVGSGLWKKLRAMIP
jgi:uncharacterized membrane protein YkvA (DUF1232 family)